MEIIKLPTFLDHRGSFTPLKLDLLGMNWNQCSISYNQKKFTFRGMHYQSVYPQTKFIKVVKGSIIDFMIDLKTGDVDFCEVDEQHAVLIPNDKAHGFLTLEDETFVTYFVDAPYSPENEKSIPWFSNKIIKDEILKYLGGSELIISEKDNLNSSTDLLK